MLLMRSHLARQFARSLADAMAAAPFANAIRKAEPQEEHKATASHVAEHLAEFLRRAEFEVSDEDILFDWEGNKRKPGTQQHSYTVLGTGAHPDAAVLKPFTCAIEFDREGQRGFSGLKDSLMKASVHVLSGAYDACVAVYIIRSTSKPSAFIDDGEANTSRLLAHLQAQGLFLTFVRLSD